MFNPASHSRIMGIAILLPFLFLPAAPANAGSEQAGAEQAGTQQATDYFTYSNCPLERIGTQLVRCDVLTGTGVDAPYWIPEQE
ncbi:MULTISPECIES: hypothetical protein [Paenarthrobacter]|jgi:hypothetical protein|uniref:hypothetical protein n=1 Tax=Paenarthrobacter TaxID=1742992 RepID=UPI001D0C885F|nr:MULTISPECIES: hypothetical protein [Paenarthrobacter]MCX8456174.1 hypothetical protein [Paenarthrobacter ureafaciens]MCY0975364.1 hypothetical protein [Paenarthrobacter ureafaciens]UOD83036.1 hypothetical protein MQZ73_09405 [Paenarthrobacter ureafaciens]WNZ02744.1 hypothetical protein PVT25_13960 [Paenarthrobacter ureafaciens]